MIEITVLLENTKPLQSDFEIEHGLSFHVKTSQSNFIFDCGQTNLARNNARRLKINLSEINFVVLSHSHYDHSAGYRSLNPKPKIIYTGKNFWREKFSVDGEKFLYKGCGFTQKDLIDWNIEQKICDDILQLDNDSWLIGNILKRYDFETIPKKFVCGDEKIFDDFSDEIILVIREEEGLAIITGCAHRGILNIVSTVHEKLNLPIKRIIGGIHLIGESDERIEKTFNELKNFGVKNFSLCHCSGIDKFKISTGSKIFWL